MNRGHLKGSVRNDGRVSLAPSTKDSNDIVDTSRGGSLGGQRTPQTTLFCPRTHVTPSDARVGLVYCKNKILYARYMPAICLLYARYMPADEHLLV